jgi:2'-5' RNA ligase
MMQMEYGITLNFEQKTAKRISGMIALAHQGGGNSFMLDHAIPPHITVSMFNFSDGDEAVIEAVSANLNRFHAGMIKCTHLGAFIPDVLFVAPVLSSYLLQFCKTAHEAVKRLDGVVFERNYTPYNWVPHATLAARLVGPELEMAFSTVSKSFFAFEGMVASMALINCETVAELKAWQLE